MLYRMYVRYAEKKDWKVTVLDVVPGEGDRAGQGDYPDRRTQRLRHAEKRERRAPPRAHQPTDDKKRRHTTFAGVEVLPVLPDDIEVDLNPADVRVDVYAPAAPAASASTPPTRPCASRTSPRTSW